MSELWFKVLKGDRSCDGGIHTWSLPVGDTPGDWHAIPAEVTLKLCRSGFHLTNNPVIYAGEGRSVYKAAQSMSRSRTGR